MRPSTLLRLAFPVLVGLGCGDPPVAVTVTAENSAVLALREGAGPWRSLVKDGTGQASIEVEGPYTLLSICAGAPVLRALAAGPGDGDAWEMPCPAAPTGTVPVTARDLDGSLDVKVSIGSHRQSLGSDGVTFEVAPGTYDVAFVDHELHRVLVRRGVPITAATTIEVDMAQAVSLIEHPIDGLPPAGVHVSSGVETAGGTQVDFDTGFQETIAWSLPPGLVSAGDRHRATVTANDYETGRYRARTLALDPTVSSPIAVTLPAALGAVTTHLTPVPLASYATGETWERAKLTVYRSVTGIPPQWHLEQHSGAGAANGAIAFPDPTTVAGWDPALVIDPAQRWTLELKLERDTPDGGNEAIGLRQAPSRGPSY